MNKLQLHSELLSFFTLSIVQYSRKEIREHSVSETGSVSSSGRGGGENTLERANLNHRTT
jgi:hypothetical protein